jgi:AraC family transcriptional regulator
MNPMFDSPLVAGSRGTLPAERWAALGENCYNGGMGMQVETLASGFGWSVREVVCSSGPRDRRFEEQHTSVCIAAVMQGSFQYRTLQGAATLASGAILFGNHQSCFECGHDHGVGDRCLSFLFDPGYFETILSSLPGVRTAAFKVPRLPPLMSLSGLFAEARLVRSTSDPIRFEQLALELAAAATRIAADSASSEPNPTWRDEQRITTVLRRIETDLAVPLSIGELAANAAMSPYHFLRTFRRVVGMTPHQFILRMRLDDAAVQLRRSSRPVLDIALDTGFADLSTFNRRFRTMMGVTPSAYRGYDRAG